MKPDELVEAFRQEFAKTGRKGKKDRRFSAGLLLSFIALIKTVRPAGKLYVDSNAFFGDFPLVETNSSGGHVNQLKILAPNPKDPSKKAKLGIRSPYNKAQRYFTSEHKRFDYPNAPGHATGQWHQYRKWIDSLVGYDDDMLAVIDAQVREHVLGELPSHEFDVTGLKPPVRRFERLLDSLATFTKPNGAAFQGAAYAYIRADAPHLNLDIAKVQAGSARLNRVGDIDGWSGEKLVLSAEVKGYSLSGKTESFDKFAHDVSVRAAMGIVIAHAFADDTRQSLQDKGLITVDLDELKKLVRLWDPLKQEIAVQAFGYYVHHVEKHAGMIQQFAHFEGAHATEAVAEPLDAVGDGEAKL